MEICTQRDSLFIDYIREQRSCTQTRAAPTSIVLHVCNWEGASPWDDKNGSKSLSAASAVTSGDSPKGSCVG